MRLYPKKLRNLNDLEREKKLLRKQSRQLASEEFLTVESLVGKSKDKKKKKEENETPASFVDMLPISNPMIKMGLKIVEGRLLNRVKNTSPGTASSGPRTHPVRKLAFEFIGGYLKWKAIELSFKGIKYLIKKRKEKKEWEQNVSAPIIRK
jgi:hypothetical protein